MSKMAIGAGMGVDLIRFTCREPVARGERIDFDRGFGGSRQTIRWSSGHPGKKLAEIDYRG